MKLKLSNERDVSILDVSEEVSIQNVSVLRVGITKLLNSGKNKIILNLGDVKQLGMDVIREIVKLHLIAAELKGDIVLVGQGGMVLQAVKSFSSPPPIRHFSTKDAAMGAFSETPTAPVIDSDDHFPELKARLAKLEAENKILKGKTSSRNVDEVRRLRFENGVFQSQFSAMEEQLRMLVRERKQPFEMESLTTKINQLEVALGDFLEKEGLLPKK